jgi:hypothetical protein
MSGVFLPHDAGYHSAFYAQSLFEASACVSRRAATIFQIDRARQLIRDFFRCGFNFRRAFRRETVTLPVETPIFSR